jgi:hypothetical protein
LRIACGRQRLTIHGAIDLVTGRTRVIEAALVNAISVTRFRTASLRDGIDLGQSPHRSVVPESGRS